MVRGVRNTAVRAAGVIAASTHLSNAKLPCRGLADFANAIPSHPLSQSREGAIGGDRCNLSSNDKWNVALCAQKILGGPLYKLGKSMGRKSIEMDLPTQAFAMVPISDVLDRVSIKLSELLKK